MTDADDAHQSAMHTLLGTLWSSRLTIMIPVISAWSHLCPLLTNAKHHTLNLSYESESFSRENNLHPLLFVWYAFFLRLFRIWRRTIFFRSMLGPRISWRTSAFMSIFHVGGFESWTYFRAVLLLFLIIIRLEVSRMLPGCWPNLKQNPPALKVSSIGECRIYLPSKPGQPAFRSERLIQLVGNSVGAVTYLTTCYSSNRLVSSTHGGWLLGSERATSRSSIPLFLCQ